MSAHTITNALSFITFINREAGENLVTPGENFGEFLIDETGVSALTPTIESMGVSGLFHDECMAFLEFSKDCHLEFPCTVEQARRWALDVLGLEIQMDEQAEARGTHGLTRNAEAAKTGKKRGRTNSVREQALRSWLQASKIPEDDWRHLKSRHKLSQHKLYEALKGDSAFTSEHERGVPINKSSFIRSFWKNQKIAALE